MQKAKVKFSFPTVQQIPAGEHDVIIDGDRMYLAIASGLPMAMVTTTNDAPVMAASTPAAPEPAAAVADDTKPAKKTKKAAPAPAPVKTEPAPAAEEAEEEQEELGSDDVVDYSKETELEFDMVKEGQKVKVFLDQDGLRNKLWAATVVPTPEDGDDDRLYVTFTEDNQTDYLRAGDKLFKASFKF